MCRVQTVRKKKLSKSCLYKRRLLTNFVKVVFCKDNFWFFFFFYKIKPESCLLFFLKKKLEIFGQKLSFLKMIFSNIQMAKNEHVSKLKTKNLVRKCLHKDDFHVQNCLSQRRF